MYIHIWYLWRLFYVVWNSSTYWFWNAFPDFSLACVRIIAGTLRFSSIFVCNSDRDHRKAYVSCAPPAWNHSQAAYSLWILWICSSADYPFLNSACVVHPFPFLWALKVQMLYMVSCHIIGFYVSCKYICMYICFCITYHWNYEYLLFAPFDSLSLNLRRFVPTVLVSPNTAIKEKHYY